ncbi:MAG TPA: phosphoribosylanthranilate isomerase, partial [Bacteroidota bacterium]|nr:phosphoribosylanthranilate isomerase [Bacteroidota bacterium]
NLNDAECAIECGTDALGFIFVPASPRCISIDTVVSIISRLPSSIIKVGVFVNESQKKIHSVIEQTGITHLQLHGEESPEETTKYSIPVWKAFRVSPSFDVASIKQYSAAAYLLDAYSTNAYGGTGQTFDWRIAVEAKQYGNIILSGGLNPQNIAAAVRTVQPFGIDVNSGVESAPGKKNSVKLKMLFDELKRLV